MLEKGKKILALSLLSMLLLTSTIASAEKQSATSTRKNVKITYSLNCTFKVGKNDSATATTKWDGKKGYKVKTQLYQCQNAWSDYKSLGKSLEDKTATVTGSVKGVWKFKSKHFFHTNQTSKSSAVNDLLAEYTDW